MTILPSKSEGPTFDSICDNRLGKVVRGLASRSSSVPPVSAIIFHKLKNESISVATVNCRSAIQNCKTIYVNILA